MPMHPYSANPARDFRLLFGHNKLKSWANDLKVTVQYVSKSEQHDILSDGFRERIERYLLKQEEAATRSQDRGLMRKIEEARRKLAAPLAFGDDATLSERTSLIKSGWESRPFDPIEREAFTWALQFRNSALLQELAGHARLSGLGCTVVRDGVVLRQEAEKRTASGWESLFVQPATFNLKPGTVVLLGGSSRHPHAAPLFWRFSELLGRKFGLSEFPDRPAYIGYPTCLKSLVMSGEEWHSNRYMKDGALFYEDVAVILHAPLAKLFWKHPYGKEAQRLIWIASLQRLANGVAVRLLRDREFKDRQGVPCDFESSVEGVFIFRVIAKNDGHGTVIRIEQCYPASGRSAFLSNTPAKRT